MTLGRPDNWDESSDLPRSEPIKITGGPPATGFGVPATVEDWDSSASFEWIPPEKPCSLLGQFVGIAEGYNSGDFSARFIAEDPDGKGGPAGGTYSGSIDFNFEKRRFLYERICRAFGKGKEARDFIATNGFYPTFENLGVNPGDKCVLIFEQYTKRSGEEQVGLNSVAAADTATL
jgi:hypothetical protein